VEENGKKRKDEATIESMMVRYTVKKGAKDVYSKCWHSPGWEKIMIFEGEE
jgi:hypothetical protein